MSETRVVAGLFVAVTVAYVVWLGGGDPDRFLYPNCSRNLKQIGMCLEVYADAHEGRLPESTGMAFLEAIAEGSGIDDLAFSCGANPRRDSETSSYAGPAHRVDPAMLRAPLAKLPIAADRAADHHLDGRNVLFAFGYVEFVEEADFQRLYREALEPVE